MDDELNNFLAREYIAEMFSDLVIHGWDLGRAIGYTEPLPVDLVRAVYGIAKDMGDLSNTGMFDKPVNMPDDASTIDKLLALTGRDPHDGLRAGGSTDVGVGIDP